MKFIFDSHEEIREYATNNLHMVSVADQTTGDLAALGEFDEDLFLKLKELRNELAREAGIPAYAVFHNSTLEGLARLKPTTRRGAMNVHGIGEQKAAKYLDDFLEVIAEHCEV